MPGVAQNFRNRWPQNYRNRQSELWDGTLYAPEPSGGPAEVVGSRLIAALSHHADAAGLGWVVGSNQGFLLARAPDRVLSPDVAFVSYASLPTLPARGFIDRAPDFAAEVRSPDDSACALHAKAGVWLGHRVPVVWAVDPIERTVTVFRPGADPSVVHEPESANAAPVLPHFSVSLLGLFQGIPR
jgi:Uma2 family endonuclease